MARAIWGAWLALTLAAGLAAFAPCRAAQVSEIELRTDPAEPRVRPLEWITVQVRAYTEEMGPDGVPRRTRLKWEVAGARFDADCGRLSRPFRYQGPDDQGFEPDPGGGWASLIWGRAEREFLLQDAVLFVAPEQSGTCRLQVRLDGRTAGLEIEVDPTAPQRLANEKTSFRFENEPADPHLELARHYAPVIAQETWFDPKADYLARFDFDGDWRGDNNWAAAEEGSSQAYVYYAAMETETHWFLLYNFFHPRDYSDKCVAGTCHENDSEGLILTIAKDGSQWGSLQVMETLAHDNLYSYALDRRVRERTHGLDGRIETLDGRPVVFVEAGGHGVFSADDFRSSYRSDLDQFTRGLGVTYVYRGRAERPRHPDDRGVGYQLLPIYRDLWLRSQDDSAASARTFDDYFVYSPVGDRPRPPFERLAGTFLGREKAWNKAKPFWGWHDRKTDKKDVLAVGQWGLDPAYAVSQNLRMPEPFSLEYVHNPYLGIGAPPAEPEPPPVAPSWRLRPRTQEAKPPPE